MTAHDSPPLTIQPETARERFLTNVIANVLYSVLSIVVMFWYIPFLIRNLGLAGYGLLPLSNSIIGYVALLADAMSVTALRFVSIGLSRRDHMGANRAFSASIVATLIASALITPVLVAIAWWFPLLFHVSPGLELQSRLLFGLITAGFVLTLLGSSFNATALALHRFDLRRLVEMAAMLVRVGVVVVLFQLTIPAPWQIGSGFLLSGILSFAAGWLICRQIAPYLRFDLRLVRPSEVREMGGLGGWMAILRVGIMLFQGTSLLVVNFVFGSEATGRYGALLLVVEAIRLLGDTVASVLSPAIMSRNATSESWSVRSLAERASKLMGLAIALPVGLAGGLAGPLLLAWLGPDFARCDLLLLLMVGPVLVNLSVVPMAYVLISRAQIRWHSWTTLILGLLNVVFSLLVAVCTDLGIMGVAAVNGLLSVTNSLLTATYCSLELGLRWRSFYSQIGIAVIHAATFGTACYLFASLVQPRGLFTLACVAAAMSVIYVGFVAVASLNQEDRTSLLGLLPPNLQKRLSTISGDLT
jgi:membrane protein EpsK